MTIVIPRAMELLGYYAQMQCKETDLLCARACLPTKLPLKSTNDAIYRVMELTKSIKYLPGVRWSTHDVKKIYFLRSTEYSQAVLEK